jgi:hypothetical protein
MRKIERAPEIALWLAQRQHELSANGRASGSLLGGGGPSLGIEPILLPVRLPTVASGMVLRMTTDPSPEIVERFSAALRARIAVAGCDGILLSGGLDTSTIAALAHAHGSLRAVTVCVRSD